MSASTNVTIWCDGNPRTHDGRCHQSDTAPAKALLRDIEPWLRSLVTSAARPSSPASRITGHDESMTITVNGRAYTYSTAGVTAAELADRINATHPGGIVARASDAGRITLTAC